MNEFLTGMAAAGSLGVGLIFLRLWRDTGDRFFAFFGVAFWVLALDWVALVWAAPASEHRHYFYVPPARGLPPDHGRDRRQESALQTIETRRKE